MKNFIEEGKTIEFTPVDADVKSGMPVVVGDLVGVSITDGAIGETITLSAEGVYSLPKGAGAIKKGQKVYVNVTEGVTTIVATSTGNTFAGYAWEAAAAGDASVNVRL